MADLLRDNDYEEESESKLGLWIAILLVLLILGLVGAGYYLFLMLRAEQTGLGGELGKEGVRLLEVTKQVTNLQKEMAALHSQVALLERKLLAKETDWQQMLEKQANLYDEKLAAVQKQLQLSHAQIESQIQALQNQFSKTKSDVLIADAEYLLSVASQKLQLVGDVDSGLEALMAADELLRQSGDPAVFKVREALAQEITALKRVKAPDVVGISARILALEEKIESLPLFLPHMGKVTEAPSQGASQTTEPEADKGLLESWKEVLVIRRREKDRPVEAILTPEEVEAIRHALILKLETARFAAVRAQPELYRNSLQSATKWLQKHFDTKDKLVQEFQSQLVDLTKQPVSVQVPEIGKALRLLRNLPSLRLEQGRLPEMKPIPSKSPASRSGPAPAPAAEADQFVGPTPRPKQAPEAQADPPQGPALRPPQKKDESKE